MLVGDEFFEILGLPVEIFREIHRIQYYLNFQWQELYVHRSYKNDTYYIAFGRLLRQIAGLTCLKFWSHSSCVKSVIDAWGRIKLP